MKTVDADFNQRRSAPPWLVALTSALVITAIGASTWAWRASRSLGEARAAAARLPPTPASEPVVALYDRSARQLLRERSAPWPKGLTALELVALQGVTVSGLSFEVEDGVVRVQVTADDHARLIEYVQALNEVGGDSRLRWSVSQVRRDAASIAVRADLRAVPVAPPR